MRCSQCNREVDEAVSVNNNKTVIELSCPCYRYISNTFNTETSLSEIREMVLNRANKEYKTWN